jgi:phosphoribosyl 1,2-cyclic phosphate phosphodiesterase
MICGTAAAEGWPALFCRCRVCLEARRKGGKDLRTRATYALGNRIRVDLGPDTMAQSIRYALPLEELEHLLVTHSHEDHWLPHELYYRRPGFSEVPEDALLHVYGNKDVLRLAARDLPGDLSTYRLEYHEIRLWKPIDLGRGVTATPVLASHAGEEMAVNYVLNVNGAVLLQGNDTGWYPEETWEFLSGLSLNVVVLDCTYGSVDSSAGHLGCASAVRARDLLAKVGALAEGHRFIATHFSHNGGWLHEELEAYLNPRGIEVAYDGMIVKVAK